MGQKPSRRTIIINSSVNNVLIYSRSHGLWAHGQVVRVVNGTYVIKFRVGTVEYLTSVYQSFVKKVDESKFSNLQKRLIRRRSSWILIG